MKLTRLELSGFKSFADTVTLTFEQGVTAIVGPNGCGKSNVSDAVRWVLGEQSARLLRGGKMEDVIFQGSTARRPVNVTEVSLFLDNSDGDLPIAYREVVVTRRLSRSGQSDYLLNGSPVRLRDIQDLLRGTGLGSDAGVVIEAKMIDLLLSDRADERRSLFEEAAGIGLYRDRKHSTERRLEETATDLQRVEDLIAEVQSQIRSLARQRGKAERHAKLTEEKFAVQITLARRLLERLSDEAAGMELRFTELTELLPAARQRLAEDEQRREEASRGRAAAEGQRTEIARRLGAVRVEIGKLDGDLALAAERLANATARRLRAQEERSADGAARAAGAWWSATPPPPITTRPPWSTSASAASWPAAPRPRRTSAAGSASSAPRCASGSRSCRRRPRRFARSRVSGRRSRASSPRSASGPARRRRAPRGAPGRARRRRAPARPRGRAGRLPDPRVQACRRRGRARAAPRGRGARARGDAPLRSPPCRGDARPADRAAARSGGAGARPRRPGARPPRRSSPPASGSTAASSARSAISSAPTGTTPSWLSACWATGCTRCWCGSGDRRRRPGLARRAAAGRAGSAAARPGTARQPRASRSIDRLQVEGPRPAGCAPRSRGREVLDDAGRVLRRASGAIFLSGAAAPSGPLRRRAELADPGRRMSSGRPRRSPPRTSAAGHGRSAGRARAGRWRSPPRPPSGRARRSGGTGGARGCPPRAATWPARCPNPRRSWGG